MGAAAGGGGGGVVREWNCSCKRCASDLARARHGGGSVRVHAHILVELLRTLVGIAAGHRRMALWGRLASEGLCAALLAHARGVLAVLARLAHELRLDVVVEEELGEDDELAAWLGGRG